jgi:hypothetical protein
MKLSLQVLVSDSYPSGRQRKRESNIDLPFNSIQDIIALDDTPLHWRGPSVLLWPNQINHHNITKISSGKSNSRCNCLSTFHSGQSQLK